MTVTHHSVRHLEETSILLNCSFLYESQLVIIDFEFL